MNRTEHELELMRRYLEGVASLEETRELESLIVKDASVRQDFLRYTHLDSALAGVRRSQPSVVAPRRSVWLPWRPLAVAAAAVVVLGLTWWMLGQTKDDAAAIVTVLFAEDCQWKKPDVICEGERLVPQTLSLAKGMAVVRFDGGAEMVLRGETELELQSATQAKLLRGDVIVRAEGEAAGFKLDTPSASLLDLGTEFAVKVNGGAATELRVSEGEVAYAQGGVTKTLQAGKAVRLERSKAPQSITGDAPRFGQLVREANPRERADLMIVHEGFQYDEGSYAPGEITKGKGWAGPWRLRGPGEQLNPNENDSTTDMRIVHGRLTVPWPVPGGRLGMLEMPAGRTFRVRPMAEPIAMDRDGVTYFSVMTQEPDHSTRPKTARPQEGVRLTFRSSAEYRDESLSFGWDRRLQPQIQAGKAGTFASLGTVPDEQSLLWIGKIIRRADGEDEITFRIYGQNDPLDYAEPATWHVTTRNVRMKAALDLVVLSSTGGAPRIVDELRIGPSWRSVVPIRNLSVSVK